MAFAVAGLGLTACERAEDHAATAKKPEANAPTVQQPKENPPAVKKLDELTLDCWNGVTLKLKLIPAGEFMMGSPENETERSKDEGPQHRVKISKPFFMGVYLVTQVQYQSVMDNKPSHFKGDDNLPVEQVSWYDAVEFCKRLSARTGQMVRLPTEAEWEYACRAGTTTPFNTGETISTDQANYNGHFTYGSGSKGESPQTTLAVGSFASNSFGLYDMHGNVWEWCQDWYGSYAAGDAVDPQGPATGPSCLRVLRGGSWADYPRRCRSACRRWDDPFGVFNPCFGFRVVCEPKP
jgi:formylglycine-generating enzyme required for sulfatase activity